MLGKRNFLFLSCFMSPTETHHNPILKECSKNHTALVTRNYLPSTGSARENTYEKCHSLIFKKNDKCSPYCDLIGCIQPQHTSQLHVMQGLSVIGLSLRTRVWSAICSFVHLFIYPPHSLVAVFTSRPFRCGMPFSISPYVPVSMRGQAWPK